jgi:hypothetical protein
MAKGVSKGRIYYQDGCTSGRLNFIDLLFSYDGDLWVGVCCEVLEDLWLRYKFPACFYGITHIFIL